MEKKTKIKNFFNKLIFLVSVLTIILCIGISMLAKNYANGANCDFLLGEEKDTCVANKCNQYMQNPEYLNEECAVIVDVNDKKKCEKYNKDLITTCTMIMLNQKQQTSLDNQITLIQSESALLESEITGKKDKIEEIDSQIIAITGRINEKEESINKQKKMLAGLIRVYHENNQKDPLALIGGSIISSSFLPGTDQVSQVGQKVGEMLSNIKALKIGLENEKTEVENDKNKTIELKKQLENKNRDLDASRRQKNSLLAETQGKEEKYKKKLERVERQKQDLLGDINELYVTNSAEIEALKASLPSPDSKYRASNGWYYSQKDPRWGDKRIGQSKSLLKDYGCALSSVAMVFTYHGKSVTPASMAKQPIYYWDLISWPADWNGIKLAANTNHGGVDWDNVDEEIKNDNPVIVFVRAKGRAGHYVVIHHKDKQGRYVVHDPYFGPNIFLDSTIKLLSKMYGSSISIKSVDQMILYK